MTGKWCPTGRLLQRAGKARWYVFQPRYNGASRGKTAPANPRIDYWSGQSVRIR